MGKIRRGNYTFLFQLADHPPRHVHVYRDGRPIVKWDLDNGKVMSGKISRRLRVLIDELFREVDQ